MSTIEFAPLLPKEMSFYQNGNYLSVNDANGDRVMDLPLSLVANVVMNDERHQKLIVEAYNIGFKCGRNWGVHQVQVSIMNALGLRRDK